MEIIAPVTRVFLFHFITYLSESRHPKPWGNHGWIGNRSLVQKADRLRPPRNTQRVTGWLKYFTVPHWERTDQLLFPGRAGPQTQQREPWQSRTSWNVSWPGLTTGLTKVILFPVYCYQATQLSIILTMERKRTSLQTSLPHQKTFLGKSGPIKYLIQIESSSWDK